MIPSFDYQVLLISYLWFGIEEKNVQVKVAVDVSRERQFERCFLCGEANDLPERLGVGGRCDLFPAALFKDINNNLPE